MTGYEVHLRDELGECLIVEVNATSIKDALDQATDQAWETLDAIAERGPVFAL